MVIILWPAFSGAASYFSPPRKMLQSCCTEAAGGGNVDHGLIHCMLFLSLLFPPDFYREFCSCSMDRPRAAFPQLLSIFAWRILWATKKASCEAPFGVLEILWVNTRFHLPNQTNYPKITSL